MKTAGLVLDFYDDGGEILKHRCPTPESLPEAVKTAHFLSPEERDVLRDEAFALILHNDGAQLRKFACVDEGNTVLSTLYFMETADRLPKEAVKVAAANLVAFNEEFGLPSPAFLKEASGGVECQESVKKNPMARKRDSKNQPYVGDEADWAQRTNLISVRGGADSGRVIPTANQMKTAGVSHVENLVDVSALEPEIRLKNKTASRHALRDGYSLDSYSDVLQAIDYFQWNHANFEPKDRHEYAVKTASRADELGIELPEIMERYGSTAYAPDVEAHLANRRSMAPDFRQVWDDLQEKRAMIEPAKFAELLEEADRLYGLDYEWGGAVFDPYYATFGGRGPTEKVAWAYEGHDGTKITEQELRAIPKTEIEKNFQTDFAQAFSLDPVTIFDSMPADTKQVIARMARAS